MGKRYRKPLKWTLYSLGFLAALLLESSALSRHTFFGTKLSLIPSYICCVACREGHENGGVFALAASVFWALSGVTGGPIVVILLPLAAIVAAYVCNTHLTRSLLPVMAGCLTALVLCRGGIYLERLYMDYPLPPDALELLLAQIGCSMVFAPLFWWLTRLIERTGGLNGT